jgi:hypothetical protein
METTILAVSANIITTVIGLYWINNNRTKDAVNLEHRLTKIETSLNKLECNTCKVNV